MKNRFRLGVSLALLLVACSSNADSTNATSAPQPTEPPSTNPTAPPTQPAPTATASGGGPSAPTKGAEALVGTWESASCGARKYAREITFSGDKTFASKDLVSPCPPNAKCVWSGIVDRKGTWDLAGSTVSLTTDPNVKEKTPGSPLVKSLSFDGSKLSEEGGCVYSKR